MNQYSFPAVHSPAALTTWQVFYYPIVVLQGVWGFSFNHKIAKYNLKTLRQNLDLEYIVCDF